jgi:hypothetical protein
MLKGVPNVVRCLKSEGGQSSTPTGLRSTLPRLYLEEINGDTLEAHITAWSRVSQCISDGYLLKVFGALRPIIGCPASLAL